MLSSADGDLIELQLICLNGEGCTLSVSPSTLGRRVPWDLYWIYDDMKIVVGEKTYKVSVFGVKIVGIIIWGKKQVSFLENVSYFRCVILCFKIHMSWQSLDALIFFDERRLKTPIWMILTSNKLKTGGWK